MTTTTMTNNQPQLSPLYTTIKELLGEKGCPWDRRQTTTSLVKYLHAEFNELMEAIAKDDHENICEELGDLLYLIVMVAETQAKAQHFDLNDVIRTINEKLIRRHPHVFAGAPLLDEEGLKAQWQAIKVLEKSGKSI